MLRHSFSDGGVSYATMVEEEDWLFRPVVRGVLKAESLIDGTVDLAFVALLNEALDVETENQARYRAHGVQSQ